jgi:hypothetical protein
MKSISDIIRVNILIEKIKILKSKLSKRNNSGQLCLKTIAINSQPKIDKCNVNAYILDLPNINKINHHYTNLSDFMDEVKQNGFQIEYLDDYRSKLVDLVSVVAKYKKVSWNPKKVDNFLQQHGQVIYKDKKA